MKKYANLFLIAFICNLIGHLFWSLKIFLDQAYEAFIISIPYGLFAVFGLIASIRLYQNEKTE